MQLVNFLVLLWCTRDMGSRSVEFGMIGIFIVEFFDPYSSTEIHTSFVFAFTTLILLPQSNSTLLPC